MKKLFYICSLALVLAACGNEDTTDEAKTKEVSATPEQEETQTNEETETEEKANDDMEVKDGPLLKAGQWTMNGESKVTLIKIKEDNQPYTVGPMILTVKSIKLLQHTNVTTEVEEYITSKFHKNLVDKTMNTIQIEYSIENTAVDKNILFTAIETLTTDTKVQITVNDAITENNMIPSDDTGNYKGNVVMEGVIAVPYFSGSLNDINTINIITGDVWDDDEGKKINPGEKIEIAF
ncbi:hypothetical protein [Metasolibacillus sp.]|uniref:hypothetical protein n=1 Tax=Metasolibacillus sp. TaxID=2703680 RepID=UPI0025DACC1F|nr:hypothetical protein [Metasolibacillus sp.]MCT6925602.1 hypothetical protein [Metasolibacillus sp.]MCT6941757.1 hypothetical protein [Metasolibacillus sp.]